MTTARRDILFVISIFTIVSVICIWTNFFKELPYLIKNDLDGYIAAFFFINVAVSATAWGFAVWLSGLFRNL